MVILIIVYIGLWIATFAEIFRYYKVKANAFSEKEVREAAREQVGKLKAMDPVITCDYCGYKIDTRKDSTCPNCGGAYDNDPEWKSRYDVKKSFIDDATQKVIEKREKKAERESKKILESIGTKIKFFAVIHILFMFLIVGVGIYVSVPKYQKDMELNDSEYVFYEPADYRINGDGVIYDEDGLKIRISNIYHIPGRSLESDGIESGRAKIGLVIENNSGENVRIRVSCRAINGISSSYGYFTMLSNFKKNRTVNVYGEIYRLPGTEISEMVIDEIEIYSLDNELMKEIPDPVIITTTAEVARPEYDLSDYHLIYTNDDVDIYSCLSKEQYKEGYRFFVENRSDRAYETGIDSMTIDGKQVPAYGVYRSYIPAGYALISGETYSYDDVYDIETIGGKNVKVNISFSCPEDPTFDFSTGYIELN